MALAHSLKGDRSFFSDPYFPPTVTFSPDHLDSIQTLYQIQHISAAISELAKSALTTGDHNYILRARNEIAQLSSLLVSYSLSSPSSSDELRVPKVEPKETLPSPPIDPLSPANNNNINSNNINSSNSSSNKRKHKAISSQNLYCRSCGTTQTPEWRRGPDGGKSLCNACGLHYAKIIKREVLVPSRKTETASEAMNLRSLLN